MLNWKCQKKIFFCYLSGRAELFHNFWLFLVMQALVEWKTKQSRTRMSRTCSSWWVADRLGLEWSVTKLSSQKQPLHSTTIHLLPTNIALCNICVSMGVKRRSCMFVEGKREKSAGLDLKSVNTNEWAEFFYHQTEFFSRRPSLNHSWIAERMIHWFINQQPV